MSVNKIEGVPEGWELVRIGEASKGEWFIDGLSRPRECICRTDGGTAIIRRIDPPKPTYIPWTYETCPVGALVRRKNSKFEAIITSKSEKTIDFSHYGITYEHLLEQFTQLDGTPCGTVEVPN